MTDIKKPERVQPLFLIKPGTITPRDIRRAERLTGICIVECADPASVRLMEPPVLADVPAQARAALKLFKWVASTGTGNLQFARHDMMKYFVEILLAEPEIERVKTVKK